MLKTNALAVGVISGWLNDARFIGNEGHAKTLSLDRSDIEAFRKLSSKKSQAQLEELHAWLSLHEDKPDDEDAHYVSLGIYYYEQYLRDVSLTDSSPATQR